MTMSWRSGSATISVVSVIVLPFPRVLRVLCVLAVAGCGPPARAPFGVRERPDRLIEAVHAVALDVAVALDPVRRRCQGRPLQAAGPPLCFASRGDQPRASQHLHDLRG